MNKLFRNASNAFLDANKALDLAYRGANPAKPRRSRMNKTESEFAQRLEIMKRAGEILRYEYEGITLRWADMRYTPDFLVIDLTIYARIKLIEVKGGHIWDRDIVRFKGARAFWPEFAFEMHQKTKKGWKRLH